MSVLRTFVRENSLGLFFLGLFLASVGGQSVVGWLDFNEEARAHDAAEYSYRRYLLSSQFGRAVLENWQSEYLQFLVFIMATIWLVQRGSPESKTLEDAGPESDRQQLVGRWALRHSPRAAKAGGWRTWLFGNSLLLVMGALFLGSWLGQSVTGMTEYNEGGHAAELAVGVPRGRDDGRLQRLPAPARLARVEARRRAAPEDRRHRLSRARRGPSPSRARRSGPRRCRSGARSRGRP